MIIQDIFKDDITRHINGVIKVEQNTESEIRQEVKEYVVTVDLKKSFVAFFNAYNKAFSQPNGDIGVWISGFFGSGKSHFLKMLSYLLSNRKIGDMNVVDAFEHKFEDDPAFFQVIKDATRHETDVILFNIDAQAENQKNDAAVLRTFSKMFYNHLGYYGSDLTVVRLEQDLVQKGRYEKFCEVFHEESWNAYVESCKSENLEMVCDENDPQFFWNEGRKQVSFIPDVIVKTMVRVMGMSEDAAWNWYTDRTRSNNESVESFVDDICRYLDTKPEDYRLLFMLDEVGQYVGADTNMLLRLQNIVEIIGSRCQGKVWIICTGQSAIDEVVRVNVNAFSRIQARFHTRLNLSSASVEEVIRKRLLVKASAATTQLASLYDSYETVLRNTFSFRSCAADIKGYSSDISFLQVYPFVPYQFKVLQDVFAEIRKHGNAGAHMAGGERSMISGFQESALAIKDCPIGSLVPFYRFYDTISTFLDFSIRRVIEQASLKVAEGALTDFCVNLLKLLYLIRYIETALPASLDNLVILMVENINEDKVELRTRIQASLDRLSAHNLIAERDNRYYFLTDDEQDIQRRIRAVEINPADITTQLYNRIVDEVLPPNRKFRWENAFFGYNVWVDTLSKGQNNHAVGLRFLTQAVPDSDKTSLLLQARSAAEHSAIFVLHGDDYFSSISEYLQIKKFRTTTDIQAESPAVRQIIERYNHRSRTLEASIVQQLKEAISQATVYVEGECLPLTQDTPKNRVESALQRLFTLVYSKRHLITSPVADENGLSAILSAAMLDLDATPNAAAMEAVMQYVESCERAHALITVQELHSTFSSVPYGWPELDIAGVTAQLLVAQKINIKKAGKTLTPTSPGILEALRRQTGGSAQVTPRHPVDVRLIERVRRLVNNFFHIVEVPSAEDKLKELVVERFRALASEWKQYTASPSYPGNAVTRQAINLIDKLLLAQADNIAFFQTLEQHEDALLDIEEDMADVVAFFKGPQKGIFDTACRLSARLEQDEDHLASETALMADLASLRDIIDVDAPTFSYGKLSQLQQLCKNIEEAHELRLAETREEMKELIRGCMEKLHGYERTPATVALHQEADSYFGKQRDSLATRTSIAQLVSLHHPITSNLNAFEARIKKALTPVEPPLPPIGGQNPPPPARKVAKAYRSVLLSAQVLQTEQDVNRYVDNFRSKLLSLLKENDMINLQ